jgi:hypothetical protein
VCRFLAWWPVFLWAVVGLVDFELLEGALAVVWVVEVLVGTTPAGIEPMAFFRQGT